MRRVFLFLPILIIISILSSCSYLPKKEYVYIPPHSAADKKCINKCSYAKKYCQRICELKNSRSCDCTVSFNTCYLACGGQVIEK
ncbi:MAG: hypothetical protein KIT56_10545 [Gammaproteobacteria bacterium]|nr:hypothetical protein [Gammaproteobacteria bacterium]MCW5584287.1 hypothetical protein [Gammaproteobacteria bacterium]